MKKAALIAVLVVAMVFGVVGYAVAGTWSSTSAGGAGNKTIDNSANLVQVNAKINPKISLRIDTASGVSPTLLVDFGTVDPGVTTTALASNAVTLTVNSNRAFTVTTTKAGSAAALGLTTSINPATVYALGNNTVIPDIYSITPDYSLAANGSTYAATVQYSVAQQ